MDNRVEKTRDGWRVRAVWATCLALGTSTHVLAIVQHGWGWDYGGMPVLTRVFWTSLTVLDPLAAILLFVLPRLGVIVTSAIMITDVAHNMWWLVVFDGGRVNGFVALQVAFLIFVAATASLAWRTAPAITTLARSPTAP